MIEMTVLREIAAQITRVRKDSAVEVVQSDDRLVEEGQLETLKEMIAGDRIVYSACVLGLLQIGGELRLYWHSKADADNVVYGEFFLQTPLLFGPKNTLPPIFQDMTFGSLQLKNTRLLDWYALNGGPIHALLRVIDGRLDDNVLIFNEKELFQSELTCDTYLKEVARTKGVFYWQYLYCKDKSLQPFEVAALERGLDFLESAFEEDCTDLRQRLRNAGRIP
ncbi:hypothetical protein [Bradyrhizobium sp. USDA 3315]